MPVPTQIQPAKNIWVAAGDGDLPRVQELIEQQSISPNAPDPFTYTPMHAAASYGQLHILDYLASNGGDVNVTDEDGETPLYTVENEETARWLVEHGATVNRINNEGVSPVDHLSEEFPQVADYLQSLLTAQPRTSDTSHMQQPSQHQQNIASDELTSSLMRSVQDIMERAEAEGRDPDEELRQVVGRTVLEGVLTGYEMTTDEDGASRREDANGVKKPRTNGPGTG